MTTSEFDSRVVVTSAQTVVDIPALMHAISHCHDIMAELQAAQAELNTLVDQVCTLHVDHMGAANIAAEHLKHARNILTNNAQELTRFIDHLSYTALIYSAAEGDAAAFAQLRAWLYPSMLSYLETGTRSTHATFATLSQHPHRHLPWKQAWRTGRHSDIWPAPFQMSAAYAAIYGAVFGSGVGSDPVDSLAMQFHVEEVSRSLMRNTHWIHNNDTPSLQAFGTSAESATPEAAAIAGGALFGWGRLLNGNRRSILVGRPRHTQSAAASPRTEQRTLRIPLNPRAQQWSRTLLPSAPGFSHFLNLGHNLGALPNGALNASASGSSSSIDSPASNSLLPEEKTLPPTHTPHEVATPRAPSALIERIGNLAEGQEHGEFEILKHETQGPEGTQRSWSVIIRGTQDWTAGTSNIQDMHTNFNAIAGLESDQTHAIKAAMNDMGIAPTEAVEFVGHSQGGIIAAQLASDTEIKERYKVAAVLTAGAPTAGYNPSTSAGMLNLENTRDQVPALDGRENANRGNNLTVHFDGEPLKLQTANGEEVFAHDMSVYREAMAHFEDSPTTGTAEVSSWMEARARELGLKDGTNTTSYVYTTQRSSW